MVYLQDVLVVRYVLVLLFVIEMNDSNSLV